MYANTEGACVLLCTVVLYGMESAKIESANMESAKMEGAKMEGALDEISTNDTIGTSASLPRKQPKIVRQWVILQILRYNFRTYTDASGLGTTDWDLEENGTNTIQLTIRVSTASYSITCEVQPGTTYPLMFTVVTNGGKKRITYQKFRSNAIITKVPSADKPYCSLCGQDICVYLYEGHKPTFRTEINDKYGLGTLEVTERGHDKYHQKIAYEVDKLYRLIIPFIKIISNSLVYDRIPLLRIHHRHHHNVLPIMIGVINRYAPDWYSRLIFQCIWTFRRADTNLAIISRDIFLMISEMIYSPAELRQELANTTRMFILICR